MAIIELRRVTKEFQRGQVTSIRSICQRAFGRPAAREKARFKALDEVDFSIEPGEVVGIVGNNGAGKSTLLKILAGITVPSAGSVRVNGTVAPLIEVGAGLIGDLTGRENIYLNGTILGLSRKQISAKFDEIVAFSELEEFLDTPLKRYSSGMAVRLGFSIATSVDADILIVDEVLAVGDVAFQRKCIDRMQEFIEREKRTVLIVGHNIRQLERICTRMLLFENGRLKADGAPGTIAKAFFDTTTNFERHTSPDGKRVEAEHSTGEVEVLGIDVVATRNDAGVFVVPMFSSLQIRISVLAGSKLLKPEINFGLHTPEMIFVTKASTSMLSTCADLDEGKTTIEITMSVPLAAGPYGVGIGIYDWARRPLWTGTGLVWIEVEAPIAVLPTLPGGTLSYLPCSWRFSSEAAPREHRVGIEAQ